MNPYSSAHSPTESVRQASDVLLCLDSADRGVSQAVTGEVYPIPITQPYNDFRLQKPQALVQGGIRRLKLNEVRFPYAIPNIVAGVTDSIWFTIYPTSPPNLTAKITISAGYRSGDEIASFLTIALNANGTIGTAATGNVWVVNYDYAGGFTIDTSTSGTGDEFTMSPIDPATIGTVALPAKSLLSIMGFDVINNYAQIVVNSFQIQSSNWASLSYTQYVDIVSVNLTRFQTIADTNTRQNSRGNLICRLYIADENSQLPTPIPIWDGTDIVNVNTASPAGSLPFVVHRQFQEPKVFRWENEASINFIDISLYDDVGNLLLIPANYSSMPNFQITFKCSEE